MREEIYRLKSYFGQFPGLNVWIISKTNICAELYWQRINEFLRTDKIPRFISKGNYSKEGLSSFNAVILLCGKWYENPIANTDIFKMHLRNAMFTLPIGELSNLSVERLKTIKDLRKIADDLEKGCGGFNFLIGVDLSSLADMTVYGPTKT